MNVFLIK